MTCHNYKSACISYCIGHYCKSIDLIVQDHVTDKNHRITELEAAFKESMEMIVSRESQLESEKRKCAHTEGELKLSQRQVTELKELQETLQSRLAGVYSQLQDREALIASLRAERQCQTEELMELKLVYRTGSAVVHTNVRYVIRQNALLSAISEKDANIALLETSPNKEKHQDAIHTLHCQKDQLVVELKEWVYILSLLSQQQSNVNDHHALLNLWLYIS